MILRSLHQHHPLQYLDEQPVVIFRFPLIPFSLAKCLDFHSLFLPFLRLNFLISILICSLSLFVQVEFEVLFEFYSIPSFLQNSFIFSYSNFANLFFISDYMFISH